MVDEIRFQLRNRIGHITLNRPATLNALTYAMIVALREQLERWAADADVYAVLIRGAGDKAFCAGGDVRALYASVIAGETGQIHFFTEEYALDYAIHRYPKPCIALMDGIVLGGGMGLAQGAWLRIATERTRLAMPEVGIGLFPDVGASFFLSRCSGALGLYLGITGVQIRAADVLYAGLGDTWLSADKVASLDRLLDALTWSSDHRADLLKTIGGTATTSLPPLTDFRPAIDQHFARASVAEIVASLERETRPRYNAWAAQTLAILGKRSPTMLCVTREAIRRGRDMALADCFRMELAMVHECFSQGDFIEGIRALIVDKDNTPRWNPPRLAEVKDEMVARFFTSPWTAEAHPLANLE